MWMTKHYKLTKEQKERGVIFSSVLIRSNDTPDDVVVHEVFNSEPDKWDKIERLKDVKFFKNMANSCGWDVVEIRRG